MNRLLCTILFLFLFTRILRAQENEFNYTQKLKQINKIIDLIKNKNMNELAEMVKYPLNRPFPIPVINNKEEFIAYYPIIFDQSFIKLLTATKYSQENTIPDYNFLRLGILDGKIWFDDKGRITTINYESSKEIEMVNILTKKIISSMHASVTKWEYHIFAGKTDKAIIWLDMMKDHSFRYIAWNLPKKITDKPDIILYNGIDERQGQIGGDWYIFKNKDWTYIVEYNALDNDRELAGYYLQLQQNGVEKLRVKLESIEIK